jgi:hypothetical protein
MNMFRKAFGPSRKEIWRQLSAETGAKFVDGGFWKSDKVQASHGQWTVTLDRYTVSTGKAVIVYTRLRAPYVNTDGFRFTIYRRGLFSGIAKMFGMQDVEIGDEQFDRDFIVKGNDEGKLRALLSNGRLRELIAAQPEILFSVKDDEGYFGTSFPDGTDELHFLVTGVIKDVARLKSLYELFAETLDHLCRIGSAYERDPGVAL